MIYIVEKQPNAETGASDQQTKYMKLIRPSTEILTPVNRGEILKFIEIVGRTCYKSEDKITEGSASKFAKMIVGRGHNSVLEHHSVTVRFTCDRGVSHELVRHRIASYSQESTRYCNYSKDKFGRELTIVIPPWLPNLKPGHWDTFMTSDEISVVEKRWINAMLNSESFYFSFLDAGWTPQEARSVLPNSLKTELVATYNHRQWKEVFKQRCAPAAHPQVRELMIPLRDKFKSLIPEIYD